MLEGFKDRADGMPYALYILQTPSQRHTDQVTFSWCIPQAKRGSVPVRLGEVLLKKKSLWTR